MRAHTTADTTHIYIYRESEARLHSSVELAKAKMIRLKSKKKKYKKKGAFFLIIVPEPLNKEKKGD